MRAVSTLKKYNLQGEAVGNVDVDEAFFGVAAHSQSIKDYIVALRANKRQWSANTKGRTEINHSNKKPWRQKGTGNARQGSFAAPQFKGAVLSLVQNLSLINTCALIKKNAVWLSAIY